MSVVVPTATTAADALGLVGVTKRFGSTVAVDGVDLGVADGELLALVGPSGCGKSTLLRLAAGLHQVDGGTVSIGGQVVDDGRSALPPEARRVGLVFQEHALFPHLSVARNVGFGVRGAGGRSARVAEMLELVGLAHHARRYPHELSGGERQRVALARALAPQPALMLLDEPFASLDPNLRARLREDVTAILRSTGTAAVFVTHDQAEALAVGDRVAVMDRGRIVQVGTPQGVFHTPATRFVASFMGEADFLNVTDVAPLAAGVDLGPSAAGNVVVVRPDDVTFSPDPDGAAVVRGAEFRGSTWCYTIELPSGSRVRSIRPHLEHVEPGATVRVALVAGHRPVVLSGDPAGADTER